MNRIVFAMMASLLCGTSLLAADAPISSYAASLMSEFSPNNSWTELEKRWEKKFMTTCVREEGASSCLATEKLPVGVKEVALTMDMENEKEKWIILKLQPGVIKIEKEAELMSEFPFKKGRRTDQRPSLKTVQTDVEMEGKGPDDSYSGIYQFGFDEAGWIKTISASWSNYVCAN